MGAYPPFELAKSISRRKAGAQPGGLETSGGVGTTPSIPCRLASLVLLNLKMAGGLKVGSPTIGGQKLQTYIFITSRQIKEVRSLGREGEGAWGNLGSGQAPIW